MGTGRDSKEHANDLERYFFSNTGNLISKWHHYFDIYETHFHRFRGKPITLLEIGVYQGGSLGMWRDYFGPAARIIGVDVNPECRQFASDDIAIEIGDQGDVQFLRSLREKYAPIDIVIDDGGHFMNQQIATFSELFPAVAENGIFLCEDLHTSYWQSFGGGYKKKSSFVEYTKDLVDVLHAWHSENQSRLRPDWWTQNMHSVLFYDSIVVVEKRQRDKPVTSEIGQRRDVKGYGSTPRRYRKKERWKRRFKKLVTFRWF